MLHIAVALEQMCNGKGMHGFKIVIGVNYNEEVALVKEFCSWNFFGFEQQNVVFVTIPCFPGILDVPHRGKLSQVIKGPYWFVRIWVSLTRLDICGT